jgi:DNA polymerase I-like protein with 3'-5' exonuclease and polymerase domains
VQITIDLETSGLNPRADELRWVGFAVDDGEPYFLRHPDDAELIGELLELPATFCAHGGWFDAHFLEAKGYRIPPPERWEDTQILAHVAGIEERRKGATKLSALTKRLIAAGELPADALEPEKKIKSWRTAEKRLAKRENRKPPELGDAPDHLLYPYLAADLEATRTVARYYRPRVNGQGPVLELERACAPAVFAAERRGVPVDLEAASELCDRTATNTAALLERLRELTWPTFNPASIPQREKAFQMRGTDLSWISRTPSRGWPQFTKEALSRIGDELALTLIEYVSEKSMRDFAAGLWARVHDGRLYGTFRQVGTETGRMSSGNPNLQNLPKSDLRVRYCIAASEGHVLAASDLDNLEVRVMACYAPGGGLEQAFADGVDVHQRTADELGIDRGSAKQINYGVLYGMGASRLSKTLVIDYRTAKALLDRWWRQVYPEVRQLKNRLYREVQRNGYLETVTGRRHYFAEPNHMLLNRLVSGTAADAFKAAIAELHRRGAPMILFVHDEIVLECPADEAERWKAELEEVMPRDHGCIRGLKAEAAAHKRWSAFKQPEFVPWAER